MTRRPIAAALALILALPAAADEISDTLQSALDAYNEGDAVYALEELDYARQLLLQLKTDALTQFLPEAPEGWSREVNTEMNAGLAMMGGGTGAEASYQGDGKSITLQFMADTPMVAALGGMIGNAALYGAKVERVGREKFMVQDNEVTGLVDNRILVKASGAEPEALLKLIETIDMRALKDFGK
jgi:hypothetical protein